MPRRKRTKRAKGIEALSDNEVCIICGEQLHKGASYCQHCNHYQSNWKNHLKFFSSAAGLITVIASGIIFSVSIWPDAKDAVLPSKSIEILSYSDDTFDRHFSVHNKTRSDIWIRDIGIFVEGKSYLRESALSEKIGAGEIKSVSQRFSEVDEKRDDEKSADERFFYMLQIPPDQWTHLIVSHPHGCYVVHSWLVDSTGPRMQEMIDITYGKEVGMIKTNVVFEYYLSGESEWLKAEAPVWAMLVRNNIFCKEESN